MKIEDYEPLDQLLILKELCNKIYIARNISLDEKSVVEALVVIDSLFKDRENFN